ncbi:MAG: hypothetical protein IJI54_02540 [Kiritimatiellae bacterium]|nr:hypothetical protein [Kiritimatiellia bacterium]
MSGSTRKRPRPPPCATTFWIPVAGYPDYYVHFGIGVTIDFAARTTEA